MPVRPDLDVPRDHRLRATAGTRIALLGLEHDLPFVTLIGAQVAARSALLALAETWIRPARPDLDCCGPWPRWTASASPGSPGRCKTSPGARWTPWTACCRCSRRPRRPLAPGGGTAKRSRPSVRYAMPQGRRPG